MTKITYAVVDGPPKDWNNLEVINLDTGRPVEQVIECNSVEGWLIKNRQDENGRPFEDPHQRGFVARERIEGSFLIRRRA